MNMIVKYLALIITVIFVFSCESNFDDPDFLNDEVVELPQYQDDPGNAGSQEENGEQESASSLRSVLYGDVTSDGVIDVIDALQIDHYLDGHNPDPFNSDAADVDGDGQITSDDSDLICQYYVGNITSFPVEDL